MTDNVNPRPKSKGPDDLLAELGDAAFWAVFNAAAMVREAAVSESQAAIQELKEKKAADPSLILNCDEAFAAIAAVGELVTRAQLIGQLHSLRIPALSKGLIEDEVRKARRALLEEGEQAKEQVRHEEQMRSPLDLLQLARGLQDYFAARRAVSSNVTLIEALFTLNSYVFDLFDSTPYLLYDSATPGCGKTVSAERHEAIGPRAYMFVDPTPAVVFRLIQEERPLYIQDEAHSLNNSRDPNTAEINTLLNQGYKRSGKAPRCEEENGKRVVRWYSVYCPKILARIGDFDKTLLSRGISIHLTKKYGLPQSFYRVVQREAAPLKQQLQAYAAQKRKALEELYEGQPDMTYWPEIMAREGELYTPLLMHARLISLECGEEGVRFEQEAIAAVQELSGAKARLVVEQDKRLAQTLELLEVLESRLVKLVERKQNDPRWQESDDNQVAAGQLLDELKGKECWGDGLESRKHDKARIIAIGCFCRSFKPESKHSETGTHYNLLDLADKLAEHIPPEISPLPTDKNDKTVSFRTLLRKLKEKFEVPPPPEDWVPREPASRPADEAPKADTPPEAGAGVATPEDTSFNPQDFAAADNSTDNSRPADNSDFEVVSQQTSPNEEVGDAADNLTSFVVGETGTSETVQPEGPADNSGIPRSPTQKVVKLSGWPLTDSPENSYELTTLKPELSATPELSAELSAEVSAPPPQEPGSGDDDGGWIVETL